MRLSASTGPTLATARTTVLAGPISVCLNWRDFRKPLLHRCPRSLVQFDCQWITLRVAQPSERRRLPFLKLGLPCRRPCRSVSYTSFQGRRLAPFVMELLMRRRRRRLARANGQRAWAPCRDLYAEPQDVAGDRAYPDPDDRNCVCRRSSESRNKSGGPDE